MRSEGYGTLFVCRSECLQNYKLLYKQLMSDANSFSATRARKIMWRTLLYLLYATSYAFLKVIYCDCVECQLYMMAGHYLVHKPALELRDIPLFNALFLNTPSSMVCMI